MLTAIWVVHSHGENLVTTCPLTDTRDFFFLILKKVLYNITCRQWQISSGRDLLSTCIRM